MRPAVIRWATCPCRPTTIWNPAIFPVSTYADRKCSSIRASRSASKPAAAGFGVRSIGGGLGTRPPPSPSQPGGTLRQPGESARVGGRGRCGRGRPGPGGSRRRRSRRPAAALATAAPCFDPISSTSQPPARDGRRRPATITPMSSSPSAPANNAVGRFPFGDRRRRRRASRSRCTAGSTRSRRRRHRQAARRTTSRGATRTLRPARPRPARFARATSSASALASVIHTVVPSSGSSNASDRPIAPRSGPEVGDRAGRADGRASSIATPATSSVSGRGISTRWSIASSMWRKLHCPSTYCSGSPAANRASIASRWATIRSVGRSSRIDVELVGVRGRLPPPRTAIGPAPDRRPSRSSPPTALATCHRRVSRPGRRALGEQPRPLLGGERVDHHLQIAGEDRRQAVHVNPMRWSVTRFSL